MLTRLLGTLLLFLTTAAEAQQFLACSAPQMFDQFATGNSTFPAVASNAAGDTTVVWQWQNAGAFEMHTVRYSSVTHFWTSVFTLTSTPRGIDAPQVAVASTIGQPFVTWVERLTSRYDVLVQPFNGFSTENLSVSNPGGDNTSPQVAVDDSGNAHLVWMSFNGSKYVIQTARSYGFGSQWVGPVPLSDPAQSAFYPQIGVDHFGNAHAVWNRFDGSQQMVQTAAYDWSNNAWSTPVTLGQGAAFTRVAVTPDGDAHFLWTDSQQAVQTARYSRADRAWIGRVAIAPAGNQPQIAAGPAGDAMAVWIGPQNTIQMSSYSIVTKNWSTPVTIVDLQDGVSRQPAIAFGPLGDAIVVWTQVKSGYSVVYAAWYKSPLTAPAISAVGLGQEPRIALGKQVATIIWNTVSCNLSAGCPKPGRVQAIRCDTPKPPDRRRVTSR